jgi:hypothetical protein
MKHYTTTDLPPYPKNTPPTDDAIAEWIAPLVKISPRTVEAWPIPFKKLVGRRVRRWQDVSAYVLELLNNAPLYRGGRRRTTIGTERPAASVSGGQRDAVRELNTGIEVPDRQMTAALPHRHAPLQRQPAKIRQSPVLKTNTPDSWEIAGR